MKKYIITATVFALFAAVCIAIPIVKAELSKEELVYVTAGQTLGNRLADVWSFDEMPDIKFGVSSGSDKYNHQRFLSNFSVGGGGYYATSSTAATYTLTTAEFPADRRHNYIEWLVNLDTTLTTMASSSAPFADLKIGETYTVDLYSSTTTAATTITFAAGTGVDLQELEGGSVVVNGLEGATLKFIKKASTDVIMLVAPWQEGD